MGQVPQCDPAWAPTVRLADGQQVYEDCEQPPVIAHGSAKLTVDQSEEFVMAHYSCNTGYRIDGTVDIRCDIDSDEWQVEQLPKCVKEGQMNGISELKDEIVRNNNEVAKLADKVNAATPMQIPARDRLAKRRRGDLETPNKPTTGTRLVENPEKIVASSPPKLFRVYLSRFHPTVTSEVVELLVRDGLQNQDPIRVVSLVKKGADLQSLNFIFFKRNSHGSLFPIASRSSIGIAPRKLLDTYSTAGLKQMNGIKNENHRTLDLCFVSDELCVDCTVTTQQDLAVAIENVPRLSVPLSQFVISIDMVTSAGKRLKSSTGYGPDGIPSIILKRCMETIAAPLAAVFNLSLAYQAFFQTAGNSHMSFLSLKKELAQRYNHYISSDQHGFMTKRSTTTNLTSFTSFVTRQIEDGHQVDAIYTDLSAAFDKMNHQIAIAKFDRFGMNEHLLLWLQSYLCGRSMSVKIGDHISAPFPVCSGVPQVSHLGPFLFLLYMNDVNSILKCAKLSYADDLKLYHTIKQPLDMSFLQEQLENFAKWCQINRLSLNVSKCSVISFGRKHSLFQYDYALAGVRLLRESTVKDLGVLIDAKLTFKDHISYVVAKASSQRGFLFRFAKKFKDIYCLKTLYCSIVRPVLEYASPVWSPYYQNEIQHIEAIQRKFIHFALRHLRWTDPRNLPSYKNRCMLIGLELLEKRRNMAKVCFIGDLLQESTDDSTATGSSSQQQQQKKRKNARGQNIQEETAVSSTFAAQLDLSCMAQGLIHAPEIDNGYVVKYNRRKKDDHIFLVAFYECDDHYELQPAETDRLFCSGKQWIGTKPSCISNRPEGEEDDEEDEDYDEEDEEEEEGEEEEQQPDEVEETPKHELLPHSTPSTTTEFGENVDTSETELHRAEENEVVDEAETDSDDDNMNENDDGDEEEDELPEEPTEKLPEVIQTTSTTTSTEKPQEEIIVVHPNCGSDRGGCDHECQMVYHENEVQPTIQCSCFKGFELDFQDRRTCRDINECEQDNGGCEQICTNKPGSFECTCQPGLQIDVLDGKSCIDINECLLRNGHGPCQDTCINEWRGYNCSCEGLPGTRLSPDGHGCEDAGECPSAGCSHQCLSTMGRTYCICPVGFVLGDDWKTCQDINECEDDAIAVRCPDGCENTHGSYRCLEEAAPEPEPSPRPSLGSSSSSAETASPSEDDEEDDDGEEDGEGDFDEEADNENGNEERPSTPASTTTTTTTEVTEIDEKSDDDEYDEGDEQQSNNEILPAESDDDKEDVDVDVEEDDLDLDNELPEPAQRPEIDRSNVESDNEVEVDGDDGDDGDDYDDEDKNGEDEEIHHQQPPHRHRHHHGDRRPELEEESEIKPLEVEPHGTSTESSSPVVVKIDRDEEEQEEDEFPEENHKENELDSDDYLEPEAEVSSAITTTTTTATTTSTPRHVVSCREGLRLNSADECEDIDECVEQDHGCDYCRNAYGGYQCTCPTGYELADDDKTCQDVNECERRGSDDDDDDEDYNEVGTDDGRNSASVGVCSHECHNTVGSFECRCPDGFHLNTDRRTCVRDFCADLYENSNKTRCSHECKDGTEGFICVCPEFHILDEFDRKTCLNVYSCAAELKKRCDPGVCRVITGGDYRCECPQGYQEADHSCHDLDECELGRHMCSHDCFNTPGSYRCGCPHGLTLSTDNRTCDDVDECQNQDRDDICGDLQCLNTYGSYKCVCPEGKELDEYGICRQMDLCTTANGGCSHICTFFNRETFCDCPDEMELAEDGKTCVLINECERNNGGCSHICDSQAENLCRCPEGFNLADDKRNCHDINECLQSNGGCEQKCSNLPGSHECGCFDGFETSRVDNRSCSDIDECSFGYCDQRCHNTEGSFHCSCNDGYQLVEDGRSCRDVNECETNNGRCSHICSNRPGSYECSCPAGLYLTEDNHSCDFIDECELNNGGCSHDCHYHRGVTTCSCPKGFELEKENLKTCVDVNECNTSNGGCSNNCINLPGSYHCTCPEGFELNHNLHTCNDVDECIENNGNCSDICINLLGEYRCACEAGYELEDDQQTCRDVDECSMKIQDCSHICTNVPGTFECECPDGYRLGRDTFTCEDINECETLPNRAGCEHHCVNLPGSYRCGCEDGHMLESDNRTCSDIDECSDEHRRCSHDCVNTKGGFECSCPLGLRLDVDEVSCLDIDECKINSFNGGCSHICENEHGSFKCSCPEGWVLGDDEATCEDVDECSNLNGGCSQRCLNHRGGYTCGCNPGFALMADNKTCEVSNPCALRNGGCEHFCSFKNGNTVCSCREGYTLNKTNLVSCVDHDECQLPSDNNCQQKCVNTNGGFQCECYSGYEKNALGQCIDINECLEMNGGCGPNTRCINLAGSFRCMCPPGFKMGDDRRNCFAIRNRCPPLTAPNNGEISCSRSRHKSQFFYKTKCSIWCKKGFKLLGAAVRQCNGSGIWDEAESLCVPHSCPRLQRPEHGTLLPVACTTGKIYSGERCVLHCKPGYRPVGKRATICDATHQWTPSQVDLRCVPVTTPQPVVPIKPYIQCPPDVHHVLPVGQYTMKIRLEQPKSNVDWYQFIDSHPAWGKQLETELPAGETAVTFRARSPNSNMNDVCRVLIRIRERRPPQVANCPDSFNVRLEGQETSRSVFWVEPNFETESEIKQLYKSHTSGQPLIAGVHYVNYVATDADGLSAKCSFGITVKASPEVLNARRPVHRPHDSNKLENHESFLICPGKSPIRVDANDPLHIPQGCVVKNIRIKQKLARLRHQQHVLQRHLQELERSPNPDQMAIEQQHKRYNNLLRYYSSWDNAASHHQQQQVDSYAAGQPQRHPRRWFKRRSKDNDEELRSGASAGAADGEKP
ncbi:uncharacterized protein LOC128736776 [Sabethes cyaneus]|uniref:uncharacterized protein LOC128736776 n=1 Tax=Sabethes cyaneus TaxID=53552 RepID=UPI00237E89AA|nr:uncharacterized protein LOC128736776 [Sabethes cyaneus]